MANAHAAAKTHTAPLHAVCVSEACVTALTSAASGLHENRNFSAPVVVDPMSAKDNFKQMTPLNVMGTPLVACSFDPVTGFFRDGCCNTNAQDQGTHVVCAQVTAEFLAYSRLRGNDLMTRRPESRFAGLRPGDRWCLCALRWREALEAGVAPPVHLEATHAKALEMITLQQLQDHAL